MSTYITTTSYGSWHRRTGNPYLTLAGAVEAALGEWQSSFDVDAIVDEYRAAINAALPDSVSLCGDEFYGPYYEVDCADQRGYPQDEDGGLDIAAIIEDVDFWAIAERHDTEVEE